MQTTVMATTPIPEISSEHEDPCPTPLAWRDVLNAFRRESASWSVALESARVRGQTIGQGPPLYFLNGFTGDLELFSLTVWLLREDFRCVLLDYPDPLNLTPRELGRMLLRVADDQGDEQFDVYATAFGAVPALTAALDAPQRIRRMILQGGFSHRRLSLSERILVRGSRYLPERIQLQSIRQRIHQQNHRHWFPPYDNTRWQFFLQNALQVPLRLLASRAAVLQHFDVRAQLSQLATPLLVLRTEGDGHSANRDQDALSRQLPQAQIESLHTCGLLPFLTHPHRLSKCIGDFLLQQDRQ